MEWIAEHWHRIGAGHQSSCARRSDPIEGFWDRTRRLCPRGTGRDGALGAASGPEHVRHAVGVDAAPEDDAGAPGAPGTGRELAVVPVADLDSPHAGGTAEGPAA